MRRLGLFGAVLLVLAVVYVAAWRTQPGTTRAAAQPGPQIAAVTSVTRSCPPPAPGTGAAHVALIALPSQAAAARGGASGAGAATLIAVPATTGTATTGTAKPGAAKPGTGKLGTGTGRKPAAPAPRPLTVSAPGALTTVTAPGVTGQSGSAGTAVAATGQMAEGFEAEQANAAGTGVVSCTHPGSDMWFVGTGADDGASGVTLYLMNTGDLPASANVTILTDAGVQTGLNTGITIAPHQFVAQPITPFVPGSAALALHVQTSSGQVAASVWEDGGSGGAWLPQAAAPATSLVIPGLTVASSAARLFVTVPGASDAQLKVVAFTAQGKFPQFGPTPVDAPAGATSSFALSSLGASPAGLELTSNVPIVAAVQVPGEGIGSFTTAVPPVTEQGIVAGNPATRGLTVGLVLTAPAGAARASVAVIGAAGSGAEPAGAQQTVTVPAGHTLAVAVPRPQDSRQPFAIVITPATGSGPLYAARVVTTGTGGLSAPVAALLPVPNAPTVITLPPVQNAYTAVLP
jgi:hypothetical protein